MWGCHAPSDATLPPCTLLQPNCLQQVYALTWGHPSVQVLHVQQGPHDWHVGGLGIPEVTLVHDADPEGVLKVEQVCLHLAPIRLQHLRAGQETLPAEGTYCLLQLLCSADIFDEQVQLPSQPDGPWGAGSRPTVHAAVQQ